MEDKAVRRASKKAWLDPMFDEDSSDEDDYSFPPPDATKSSWTSQAELARPSRTPDAHPAADDTETVLVTAAPVSVGSALRKNADGSIANPKVLPKRNKGSKVSEISLKLLLG